MRVLNIPITLINFNDSWPDYDRKMDDGLVKNIFIVEDQGYLEPAYINNKGEIFDGDIENKS